MTTDWTKIYKKYAGKWVAIDPSDDTTVLAADADAGKAYAKGTRGGRRAILHRVPEEVINFVGYEV